mmetsp:Transcript_12482/g.35564  ORF Transcript_12482/g.35564 Transcript_12482/m.35564 type:complete len:249 (-) Transcript_12482:1255-2001(-)
MPDSWCSSWVGSSRLSLRSAIRTRPNTSEVCPSSLPSLLCFLPTHLQRDPSTWEWRPRRAGASRGPDATSTARIWTIRAQIASSIRPIPMRTGTLNAFSRWGPSWASWRWSSSCTRCSAFTWTTWCRTRTGSRNRSGTYFLHHTGALEGREAWRRVCKRPCPVPRAMPQRRTKTSSPRKPRSSAAIPMLRSRWSDCRKCSPGHSSRPWRPRFRRSGRSGGRSRRRERQTFGPSRVRGSRSRMTTSSVS